MSTVEAEPEPAEFERLSQKFQKELNAGLASLVLLAVLDQADEDLYGYQIAKRLQHVGSGDVPIKQGALYPVLRQLAASGLLASRIVPSYAGPPRRYYRLTPAGREALVAWLGIWRSTRDFVDTCLESRGTTP